MDRNVFLYLCLLVTSLHHVTSFTVNRRHTSTNLADALRMLERQRKRIDKSNHEENLLTSSARKTDNDILPETVVEPLVADRMGSQINANTAWMPEHLDKDGVDIIETPTGEFQAGQFLDSPAVLGPQNNQPETTDEDIDTFLDRKNEPEFKSAAQKKDKEVMTNIVGDARPKIQTRSDVKQSNDVSLSSNEFQALLQAVEQLQDDQVEKAIEDEESEKVIEAVDEKAAEAREEVKEAILEAVKEEEEEEDEEEKERGVSETLPAGDDALGGLYEEKSQEVIPLENGEIIRTDKTVKDSEGHTLGEEEVIEEIDVPSSNDLWYLQNYMEEERSRRKRNSKREFIPTSWMTQDPMQEEVMSPDTVKLIGAFVGKVNKLQSRLDQARLVSYLEDVENDVLTDALNQATLGQLSPDTPPLHELQDLQDAITVEQALQQVKTDGSVAQELADELADEITNDLGDEDDGEDDLLEEPWRKRNIPLTPETLGYVTNDAMLDDDGDDSEEETTSLVVRNWADGDLLAPYEDDTGLRVDNIDGDLMTDRLPANARVASLFSSSADQCTAIQQFSTNCQFAGYGIDYEARALCNLHEICYTCGKSLEMTPGECDFVYQSAATMLCDKDEQCVTEAFDFLNTMKLKHRFLPYYYNVCREPCVARFLSII